MPEPQVKVYKDEAGQYRWTLTAPNGEPLAVSSESYTRPEDAERGFEDSRRSMMKATKSHADDAA